MRKLSEDGSEARAAGVRAAVRAIAREWCTRSTAIYSFTISRPTRARQLTKTADAETNPEFTHDEKHVAFMRGGNLYVMSLETGMLEQMTEIVAAGARRRGSCRGWSGEAAVGVEADAAAVRSSGRQALPQVTQRSRGTDSQEFLKKQEKELLEIVRERAERCAKRTKPSARKSIRASRSSLQARQTANRLELCPDEKCVIAIGQRSAPTDRSRTTFRTTSPNRRTPKRSRPHQRRRCAGSAARGDSRRRDR